MGNSLVFIRLLSERLKKILGLRLVPLAAVALGVVVFGLWVFEHDARLRQSYELSRLKKQTAADVSALQAKAEAATREANQQRAQAVRDLEARERGLQQASEALRERLAVLQKEERGRAEQVATLPASELSNQVAARLGLPGEALVDLARPRSGAEKSEGSAGPGGQQPLASEVLRKVDAALVELDSCRQRSAVMSQQVENCNQQVATNAETTRQQAAAIDKLNQALEAKDQILARRETEYRAELKALRGTRLGRWARVLEHVAIGVAIGAALR